MDYLLCELIVQHPDGLLEILVLHTEDDVQLVRGLGNEADVLSAGRAGTVVKPR